jgi:hypothetical protein
LEVLVLDKSLSYAGSSLGNGETLKFDGRLKYDRRASNDENFTNDRGLHFNVFRYNSK